VRRRRETNKFSTYCSINNHHNAKMTQSNNSQMLLKSLLVIQTIAVLLYTVFSVKNEGWSLFSIFTNNITSLNWNGQFNLDFSCYLTLSGIWIMWRNKFSASSIIFAVIAMIIGIIVFAPYLLILLIKEKGDLKKVLIGVR
jgi:hypothetical protein